MLNRFRSHNRSIAVTSFLVLTLVLGVFLLNRKPELRSRLLGQTHPGSIALEAPDVINLQQPFKLTIVADTHGQSVNAAGIYLRYNPNQFQVLDIDTTSSFCQFYPEKRYDNHLGLVSLACGSPHPGVSGVTTLMVLQLQPLQAGPLSISLDPKSQLLLSDGKGTNILHDYPRLNFNVLTNL